MLTPNTPVGFRPDASGKLFIPSDAVQRVRKVWTKASVKQLDRTTRFLKDESVLFQFCCKNCGPKIPMQMSRDPQSGFKVLSCSCTDRILSGAV